MSEKLCINCKHHGRKATKIMGEIVNLHVCTTIIEISVGYYIEGNEKYKNFKSCVSARDTRGECGNLAKLFQPMEE